jgi:4-amino-4-deoxy-L-arabinose transferase-like glycosyltransferase
VAQSRQNHWLKGLPLLVLLWGVACGGDRLWFALDRMVPAWDQADYLTGSLNYWQALRSPLWDSSDWWHQFWQLSSKIPPLTYVAAAAIQLVLGTGPDNAAVVQLVFSAILLGSVYGLGVVLFTPTIGLWAAGLCLLLPGLYAYRLEFLLDYPLAAMVTLSFWLLSLWMASLPSSARGRMRRWRFEYYDGSEKPLPARSRRLLREFSSWLAAIAFGLSLGLALLTKQPALFFLLPPLIVVAASATIGRNWRCFDQILLAVVTTTLVCFPWYRANWLLMLTAGKRATLDSAAAEGDPALNTLSAWTFYLEAMPQLVSWPLLIVPLLGLFVTVLTYNTPRWRRNPLNGRAIGWLAVFLLGGYLLSSLNVNKDTRYILPLLPVFALVLAVGLQGFGTRRWGRTLRWLTVGLALLLYLANAFPIGNFNASTAILSPQASHRPYLGSTWPLPDVATAVVEAEPYLQTTIGVLPSTPNINQHNINYYGALQNFQVYGRQVGTDERNLQQDARSLSWFATKTGDQGSVPEVQAEMVKSVEQDGGFLLHRRWSLPLKDGELRLYRQQQPNIRVQPAFASAKLDRVRLVNVSLPSQVPPGVPVPIRYEWIGPGDQLQNGIVLIAWELEDKDRTTKASDRNRLKADKDPRPQSAAESRRRWFHDRGVGLGRLRTDIDGQPSRPFRVTENLAMLIPADLDEGRYRLAATYLNRQTGESYPLPTPDVSVLVTAQALAEAAPELDLVTQLWGLASNLATGDLDTVFRETGRINQYDPTQDYLQQAKLALSYRLQTEPGNVEWIYALALAQVLQQDAPGAIATLERAVELDGENPYAHAYLAFVHLYCWQPNVAQPAINTAIALAPDLSEAHLLDGIAALMRGNLWKAWQVAKAQKLI